MPAAAATAPAETTGISHGHLLRHERSRARAHPEVSNPASPPGAKRTTSTKNNPRYIGHALATVDTMTVISVPSTAPRIGPAKTPAPPMNVKSSTAPDCAEPRLSTVADSKLIAASAP